MHTDPLIRMAATVPVPINFPNLTEVKAIMRRCRNSGRMPSATAFLLIYLLLGAAAAHARSSLEIWTDIFDWSWD
jgi:hypothetical protein